MAGDVGVFSSSSSLATGWKEEENGGGGEGIYFWRVIIIGRLNVPTWFGRWQDERAWQCRSRAEPLCSSPTWVWTLEGGSSLLAVVREEHGTNTDSISAQLQKRWQIWSTTCGTLLKQKLCIHSSRWQIPNRRQMTIFLRSSSAPHHCGMLQYANRVGRMAG